MPATRDPLEDSTELVPIDADGSAESSVARGRLQVTVVGRAHVATVILPGPGVFVVGRGRDCAIRIDDSSISRRHAAIRVGLGVRIKDLASVNGTRLRGRTLTSGILADMSLDDHAIVGGRTVQLRG